MKTLYYLSLFGMLSGYGFFAFVLYIFTFGRKYIDGPSVLLLTVIGIAPLLPYTALVLGIISTIVFFTI